MLYLVHNLQPLNAVTIHNSSTLLFVKHFTESFAGYTVYRMMDLFVRYNQCLLHLGSQDLTIFNSPRGPHHLITVPMGYTNTVQIYHADMSFILQDEIPCYTYPFIDELLVKSITSHYQHPDGSYKTIPETQIFATSFGSTYSSSTISSNTFKMSVSSCPLKSSSLPHQTLLSLVISAFS